jgi:ribonuclease VapC
MTVVVDTSALMAILLGEEEGRRCIATLAEADGVAISAGTVAEALIVASRRGCRREMEELLRRLGAETVAITASDAAKLADAYDKWGQGVHPAGLNFGDCFAYILADARHAGLLFVGNDFSRTDIKLA